MTLTARGRVVTVNEHNYFVRPNHKGADIFVSHRACGGIVLQEGDEVEIEWYMAPIRKGEIKQGPRAAKVRRVEEYASR